MNNDNLICISDVKINSELTVKEKFEQFKKQGIEKDNKYYFKSSDNKRTIICNFGETVRKVNVTEEILLNIAECSLTI